MPDRHQLAVAEQLLHPAGRDAEALALEHGTPTYVYDLVRIEEQADVLRAAFADAVEQVVE